MADLIQFLVLFGIGYFIGTRVEKTHYRCLKVREDACLSLPAIPSKSLIDKDREVEKGELVFGSVVISADYFKLIVAGLRNILGGEVTAYETLVDRGRREAILRMKEKVPNADLILNMRIESCQIAPSGTVEILAYGTAIYYKK